MGAESFYTGTFRDITEQKAAKEKEKHLEAHLLQSQKLEGIGRLAGGVAHDFNNQLTAILGYTEFLLNALKEGDPNREDVEAILRAAKNAGNLTQQLLEFSRREIIMPKKIKLNELIKNSEKMLRRILRENIELVLTIEKKEGIVKIDPTQVEHILINLCVNAQDAMPKGGRLLIETKNVMLDKEYVENHFGSREGPFVLLAVTDSGIGMTEEVQSHIFEPYFTEKEKGRGTGLGLATVYGIIQQNNGRIEVYSEPGKGTTFKIYLPRVEGKAEALTKVFKAKKLPRGKETVLIAEDEASVLEIAQAVLKKQGYKVLTAKNSEEALKIAKKEKSIHLFFCDAVLPKMGGDELAGEIKALFPEMKVLFTSGYTDNAIVDKGVLKSGVHFLQKPYTSSSLAIKVRDVLDNEERQAA